MSVDTSPPAPDAKPSPAPEASAAAPQAEPPPEVAPSEPLKPAEPVKPAEPAKPASPTSTGGEVEGTIASRNGSVLVVTPAAGAKSPAAGAKGNLFRFFEQQLGPFNTTGWLGIADVTVKGAKAGRLELTIDAEKSEIVVNGKKVNHFEAGNRVKLELAK